MKNYSIFLCFFFCAITMAQEKLSASIPEFMASLEQKVTELLKEKNVPGIAIAIIDNGDVIYKNGLGYADVVNQVKVNSKTGFNIGSISKMFTAWGVMKLVENGKIELDAPIENYLTRWKLPDSEYDKNKVTIRSLLSHTGGVSVHGYPGFHPSQELPTIEASLDGKNGDVRDNEPVKIIIEPQTEFKYSGGGFTILQLMIEEVTGKSFTNYMTNEIFKPLRMKHTSFTINKKILKRSAKPYDENGKEVYLERFTAQAAAGLHTTLEDLITFAKASLGKNKVLLRTTIQEMTKIVPITKSRRQAYGLGYSTYFLGKINVKGHAGSNTGWESGFMLNFESNSAIIMLTNGSQGKDIAISTLFQWAKWKTSQLNKKE